jgi:hypothetical protein
MCHADAALSRRSSESTGISFLTSNSLKTVPPISPAQIIRALAENVQLYHCSLKCDDETARFVAGFANC